MAATAFGLDGAAPLPSPRIDIASVNMASAHAFSPAAPRPVPPPVAIPRNDDLLLRADLPALSSSQHSQQSQSSPRPPPVTAPLPIPPFVFPARPTSSAPSSFSRAGGRRPKSVADLHERPNAAYSGLLGIDGPRSARSPALPDFVFNPGASLPSTPDHAFLSPPGTPQSPRTIPTRSMGGGHRRGGSEFVGGSLRSGAAFTVMSTSPTKSESGFASPLLSPVPNPDVPASAGPPHGRRGHAHRRSAAISSHDLSVMLLPTSPNHSSRGSSAPSSPADFEPKISPYPFPEKPSDSTAAPPAAASPLPEIAVGDTVEPPAVSPLLIALEEPEKREEPLNSLLLDFRESQDAQESRASQETQRPASAGRHLNRARVGFSDTLEFIPRPLSLVSSDTSSTVTARPLGAGGSSYGHSVSGSISSVISLSTPGSPTSADQESLSPLARNPSRSTSSTINDSRPSTASAVLDRMQSATEDEVAENNMSPRRRNSTPFLACIPMAVAAPESSEPCVVENAAQALPSPNKTSKRWSFLTLDPFIGSGSNSANSPVRSRPASSNSAESAAAASVTVEKTAAKASMDLQEPATVAASPLTEFKDTKSCVPAKSVTRKPSNKKKKKVVKTWSILTRKAKPRRKSRRAPTPPPTVQQPGNAAEDDDMVEQSVSVAASPIIEPVEANGAPAVVVTPTDPSESLQLADPAWQALPSPMSCPSPSLTAPEDDSSFMIDLDAALGPFNTPLPRNPEWEAAQRAGGLSKRQLHSAAGMSRFSGPGMHYSHRRAESAPEMPPFNRAGLPRFNSATAMADVFEEDEEDDGKATDGNLDDKTEMVLPKAAWVHAPRSAASTPPRPTPDFGEGRSSIDIRVTSMDGGSGDSARDRGATDFFATYMDDTTSCGAPSRRGSGLSGLSDDERTQPSTGLKSEYSASSLHDDAIVEEGVDDFKFEMSDNCDFVMESSSDSTVNSPGRFLKGKELAPVDVSPMHLPTTSLAPVSPYSMTPSSASAFPSPRSPLSYDPNRVSTAPSSVTDDTFQSLLLGEPGPEVRISSDIPSLTSSNSTMTRESGVQQHAVPLAPFVHTASPLPQGVQPRPYLPSRGAERPASFTSTAFGRRRSSLASLHRLISTSHGERSKLSMEVPVDTASIVSDGDPEKKAPRVSRAKRLSRMVQFWRPKEASS